MKRIFPQSVAKSLFKEVLIGSVVFYALYQAGLRHFLVIHTFAEIFSIVIASSIFVFVWNSRRFLDNSYLSFVGVAYLFVASLELLHTFTYKGIDIIRESDVNVPTQLWIAARYLESVAYIVAPLFFRRRLDVRLVFFGCLAVTVPIILSIFVWKNFPVCYVDGQGLTLFKQVSEGIIVGLTGCAIFLLWRNRAFFDNRITQLLIASLSTSAIAELFFVSYVNVYGFSNLAGHMLKILSYYLVYKAIVETGLAKPYKLLFKTLKEDEEKLKASEARYRAIIEDQTELICRWKPGGTLTFVNDVYCQYFGKKKEELLGQHFLPAIPEERDKIQKRLQSVSKENPVMTHEHRVLLPDGSVRWNRWINRAIMDKDGAVVKYQSVGRDITSRKIAEEELKEYKDNLEAMVGARTAELKTVNVKLTQEIEERKKIEEELNARNTFLKLLAKAASRKEYLDGSVKLIKAWTDCSAAGIRVIDVEKKIPYESYSGYTEDFLEHEERLSLETDHCICTRIMQEDLTTQEVECMTEFGSFLCYDTGKFLKGLSPRDAKSFRGDCIRLGFASLAVIPVRYRKHVIAAIHLAYRQKDTISQKTVEFVEKLTVLIGEGIHKFNLEDKMRRDHTTLEAFFEHTVTPLVFLDRDFNFIRVNEAYARSCSREVDDFPGHNHFELYPQKENEEIFKQVVSTKTRYQAFAKPFVFQDHPEWGITYWDWTLTPVLDEQGMVSFLIFSLNDVTGRIRTAQQLETAEKKLFDNQRLSDIGTLAATVAHELRNPLAAIRMASYNIGRKAQNPALDKHIENIEIKIKESEQIINNLLFYARLKAPQFQTVMIADIIKECLATAHARAPKQKTAIRLDIEELRQVSLEADLVQMKELFTNLLNNAVDAIADKGGSITVTGTIPEENIIEVVIADTGTGIDPENLRRIFEPFFSTKAKGTGLGLPLCKQIVQLHGGTIEIASREGEGTIVRVFLPKAR